jgi:hypothetical protein
LRLNIDEYGPWISKELDKTLRPTRSKAEKLVDEAARSLNDGRSFYDGLARKGERDMATKKDAASYRAARVIGHAGQEAAASLRDIPVPVEATWESLKVLKDGLSSATRSIRSLRDSASRELSGFYLLDQRSFSGTLDRIARSAERLSAFLDGEGAYLQRARTVNGIVDSIQAARRELKEKLEDSERLGREREQVQAQLKELTSRVDEITSKGDLREVLEIEKELRKEGRSFRSETLAHLKRPLRRLGDLSLRGEFAMGPDEREALSKFVQSPYKTFVSHTTGDHVPKILENVKSAINSGKMEFKPKKTGRVSAQLNQLIGSAQLAEKQEKGRRLVARRRELLHNPECKKLYDYRKGLLLKIEETRKQEHEMDERIRSVSSMTEVVNRRLTELLRVAETKTREYLGRELQLETE